MSGLDCRSLACDATTHYVDSTQNASGVNYADREFFTVLRDSPHDALFISPQVVGRVSNEVRIPMALRMNREDGRFDGGCLCA